MHQYEIDFEHCDVNDTVGLTIRERIMRHLGDNPTITADELAGVDTAQRSRNMIGGVFNGMVRAGILRVVRRVASGRAANHRRYMNEYAVAQ